MKKMLNGICVALGFVSLGIGCAGILLPILPTTPFFLLALALFAKGSERFHRWFMSTGIYKRYLADFAASRAMKRAVKLRILSFVTVLLGAGIVFSPPVAVKLVLAAVLAFHYVYFIFGIRTLPDTEEEL